MPTVFETLLEGLHTLNDADLETFRTQIDKESILRRHPEESIRIWQLRANHINPLRGLVNGLTRRRRAQRYKDDDAEAQAAHEAQNSIELSLDQLRARQLNFLDDGWAADEVQRARQVALRTALRDRIRAAEVAEQALPAEEQKALRQQREEAKAARTERGRIYREGITPDLPPDLSLDELRAHLVLATAESQRLHAIGDKPGKFRQELLRLKIRKIINDILYPENRIPPDVPADQARKRVGDALFERLRGRYPEIAGPVGVTFQLMEFDIEDVVPLLTDDEYLDERVTKVVKEMERRRELREWGAEARSG